MKFFPNDIDDFFDTALFGLTAICMFPWYIVGKLIQKVVEYFDDM